MSTEFDPSKLRRGWPPEPRHAKSARHLAMADYLREIADSEDPWLVVAEKQTNGSLVQQIQKGRYTAYRPAGAFEAKARKDDDGNGYDIWVCFVGNPDDVKDK